ncbi:hypothetical protein D3C86_959190 [compost metagenome]
MLGTSISIVKSVPSFEVSNLPPMINKSSPMFNLLGATSKTRVPSSYLTSNIPSKSLSLTKLPFAVLKAKLFASVFILIFASQPPSNGYSIFPLSSSTTKWKSLCPFLLSTTKFTLFKMMCPI